MLTLNSMFYVSLYFRREVQRFSTPSRIPSGPDGLQHRKNEEMLASHFRRPSPPSARPSKPSTNLHSTFHPLHFHIPPPKPIVGGGGGICPSTSVQNRKRFLVDDWEIFRIAVTNHQSPARPPLLLLDRIKNKNSLCHSSAS